jgi:hypothetical protein
MAPVTRSLATAAIALLAGAGSGQAASELRFTCYEDGNECQVMQELLERFESGNPDIAVAVDVVPYKAILESLPVQLAADEGPDLARVTDLGGLHQYYLDLSPYVDRDYWEKTSATRCPGTAPRRTTKASTACLRQLAGRQVRGGDRRRLRLAGRPAATAAAPACRAAPAWSASSAPKIPRRSPR